MKQKKQLILILACFFFSFFNFFCGFKMFENVKKEELSDLLKF